MQWCQIMVRVDPDTYAELERAAKSEEEALAALCRRVLMNFTRKERIRRRPKRRKR